MWGEWDWCIMLAKYGEEKELSKGPAHQSKKPFGPSWKIAKNLINDADTTQSDVNVGVHKQIIMHVIEQMNLVPKSHFSYVQIAS
jgi:hypothetical protein